MTDGIQIPEYLRDPGPYRVAQTMNYEASDPDFLLRQGYEGDAGFDLAATTDCTIDARDSGLIPCGVRLEIPTGLFGWIVARSSTMRRWGLIVLPGVIDTGFRGELLASVWNTQGMPVKVRKGDRIAQLVMLPNTADFLVTQRVDFIDRETERGDNGFGSTGPSHSGCLGGCP